MMVQEHTRLGREAYKQHARQLAKRHSFLQIPEMKLEASILACESQFENIRQIYKELSTKPKEGSREFPLRDLLCNHYYILLSKMDEIKSMTKGKNARYLPERIGWIVKELLEHSDFAVDKNRIFDYLSAYQEVTHLTEQELWWVSAELKIQLLEALNTMSNEIYEIHRQREMGEKFSTEGNFVKVFAKQPQRKRALLEHLVYRLQQHRQTYERFREQMNAHFAAQDITLEQLVQYERERQIALQVSFDNAVASLRNLDRIDFQDLFTALSPLEAILNQDPTGTYPAMDDASKDYYRKTLCRQAQKEKLSEIYYAQKLLAEAKANGTHIGVPLFAKEKDPEKDMASYKSAVLAASAIATFYGSVFAWLQADTWPWLWAVLTAVLLFPVLQELFSALIQKSTMYLLRPRKLPRMDFSAGIPEDCATMVMIPTLLSSEKRVEEICEQLEILQASNGGDNIFFALVGDLVDADREVLDTDDAIGKKGEEAIARLNEKYGQGKFTFYLRKRTFYKTQNRWFGWERKRGAILEFNRYMLDTPALSHIRYVVTLDADTKLKIGSVQQLVGTAAHPLNRPVVDEATGRVVKGYGIFQTAMTTELEAGRKSRFAHIFAGNGGSSTYDVRVSDFYMDLCAEGIYTGKGIYDLRVFQQVLEDAIPDNLVLSHDLLEGSYLRCGFINDMEMLDGFPAKYNSYSQRLHRWVRGDWQLLSWLGSHVKKRDGTQVPNPLNSISKWKIYDNLRRAWVEPAVFLLLMAGLFVLPGSKTVWVTISLLTYSIQPLMESVLALYDGFQNPQNKRYLTFSPMLSGLGALWLQKGITFCFLPYGAYLMCNAIGKTLYRLFVSRQKMLEWVTAADLEQKLKGGVKQYYWMMKVCILFGVLVFFSQTLFGGLLGILWLLAPLLAWYLSKPLPVTKGIDTITEADTEALMEDAWRIWGFYTRFVTGLDHDLPPDNVQFDPVYNVAHRTSPTNIGFYLLCAVAAKDMGFIDKEEMEARIERTVTTIEKMEKWNGHLYNWYDTLSLLPLHPYYISTVDSGNLQGYLLTVASALEQPELAKRCETLALEMDFSKLYDKERHLFSIGYHLEEQSLTNSHYDLLVSEARQTSFLAVALRQVPPKHWLYLARRPVTVNGHIGLASWSGTAFEFLMPDLLLQRYEGSLLNEAVRTCVLAQRQYVKAKTRPWGISESGYYAFDVNLNYQYKAFGIPRMGLKKGLNEEFVVAPYGSILAISLAPTKVLANLRLLKQMGAYGEYGYYEALDFTPYRTGQERFKLVKSYMAHHMGMSLLAIYNFLYDNRMKKYFSNLPQVKGAAYLLTERAPLYGTPQNDAVLGQRHWKSQNAPQGKAEPFVKQIQIAGSGEKMPACVLLSNGNYQVLLNSLGEGYSKWCGRLLAKWNYDGHLMQGGVSCTLTVTDTATEFSVMGQGEASFGNNQAQWKWSAEGMDGVTKVIVSPEHGAEIRFVSVTNRKSQPVLLEACTHITFALEQEADYMAHPAYQGLFLATEFVPEYQLVMANKRPKKVENPIYYGFCAMPFYSAEDGVELIGDLKCTCGQAEAELRRKILLSPGAELQFAVVMGLDTNREALLSVADRYNEYGNLQRAFSLSKLQPDSKGEAFALEWLPHFFYASREKERFVSQKTACAIPRNELWALGISLDLPVVLGIIDETCSDNWIEQMIEAYGHCRTKGLWVDLLLLAQEPAGYLQPLYDRLQAMVNRLGYGEDGHVRLLRGGQLSDALKNGLYTFAALVLDEETQRRGIFPDRPQHSGLVQKAEVAPSMQAWAPILPPYKERLFENGTGFFDSTTGEYCVYQTPPAPWINVIASQNFGFTVDTNGQGCTWAENSRENRLTPWQNDSKNILTAESLELQCGNTGSVQLLQGQTPHLTRHGIGYTIFQYWFDAVELTVKVTCHMEQPVKIWQVTIKNLTEKLMDLDLLYGVQPVLGVSPAKTFRHLHAESVLDGKGLLVKNCLPENGQPTEENLLFHTTCLSLHLPPEGTATGNLYLGKGHSREDALCILKNGVDIGASAEHYYKKLLAKIPGFLRQTGDAAADLLFGGRLLYQTVSCRLFGRTAFYQSGGAYGFRDQLQDTLALLPYMPSLTKEQILRCCRHQFREGDVQHWWHEPDGKGIRSRYSDDLLWLPYVVSAYIKATGDKSILEMQEPFLESPVLMEEEEERYEQPAVSDETGTVYNHCIRAIDKALRFGSHGLPLMGGGDWNDGMNRVGGHTEGESVWLAWFLLCVLNRFVDVTLLVEDTAQAKRYEGEVRRLLQIIDPAAYDGNWYRRAYFSTGEPLGSATCAECAIDSISQSWGAIALWEVVCSEAERSTLLLEPALKEKYFSHLKNAMESVEQYLVMADAGIVKLLTPPFEKSSPNPGYIMGYIAGVRENGGQYTHAAVWYVKGLLCMAKLLPEQYDFYMEKAKRILTMLNPIYHTTTPLQVARYQVEPYVVAADVYADPDGRIEGKGGWTWYTGAAGWLQQVAQEYYEMTQKKEV